MTITESFNKIIKKQKEIGYYFPTILRPPSTSEQIQEIESQLNLKFNDELIELYSFAEGTTSDGVTPCGKTGLIPIHSFLNLKDSLEYYNRGFEPEDFLENWNTGYKPGKKLFPFLEDGAGNCYWVDLNEEENQGRIYWTNTFGENPDYLFNSLTSLFNVIQECYEQNIFSIDNEWYLDCDYKKFGLTAQKHNGDIDYWRTYLDSCK